LKTKGIANPIFDSEGVRVAVFDLKELRYSKYLKDIYLQDIYLIRHRNSGKVAGKFLVSLIPVRPRKGRRRDRVDGSSPDSRSD
jgi:hypothetical protein